MMSIWLKAGLFGVLAVVVIVIATQLHWRGADRPAVVSREALATTDARLKEPAPPIAVIDTTSAIAQQVPPPRPADDKATAAARAQAPAAEPQRTATAPPKARKKQRRHRRYRDAR